MKFKPCSHPEPQTVTTDVTWCPTCGALLRVGRPSVPTMLADPKRFVVVERHDLPAHSERRAWEAFAAANLPFAAVTVAAQMPAPFVISDDFEFHVNELAARMADNMMGVQWAERFEQPAPEGEGDAG